MLHINFYLSIYIFFRYLSISIYLSISGSFSGGLTDSEVGSLQAKYNTLERDSNIHG